MKQIWRSKVLGDLLKIQNGYAFDSKSFSATSGTPLIRIRDLKGGLNTETRYTGEYEEKYVVRAGDLLVGMDGEFGCYEWKGGKALLNQRVCRLQEFTSELQPKFLFYRLNSHLKAIEEVTGFTTVKHLSAKQITSINFSFPPLPEQKRIIAILDEAFDGIDAAVANTEKNLANARELFDSYLNSAFSRGGQGWVRKRLEDTVQKSCSLSYGIVQPGEDVTGGLPIVRPTDLQSKIIGLNGLKKINPVLADGYKRTKLHGNELLLCVRGGTGAVSVAAKELAGANVTRGIVPIRFNTSLVDQEFGYFAFISRFVQDQIRAATYGTALMQINIRDVKKIILELPPLDVQQGMLRRFDEISAEVERLASICEQKASALLRLKQALLQKAFAGELTAPAEGKSARGR